ncbi:hypothetical protein CQ10_36330 [Bradyrhizobium valentinum]|uniref:Uncharacterized protein n=1 Tax=Bradyrhizobium valentinum TaxID=1518501 RepID=A0A0R3KN14_9BRAD|nr:hypothetical protein CQ10_36330 [Bradyrhizobium valentinum]KRQ97072.1 hypothetical protein CP49_28885 [Bradyrhizobium valentinum]
MHFEQLEIKIGLPPFDTAKHEVAATRSGRVLAHAPHQQGLLKSVEETRASAGFNRQRAAHCINQDENIRYRLEIPAKDSD